MDDYENELDPIEIENGWIDHYVEMQKEEKALREYETMRKTLNPEKVYVYGNEVEGLKGNIEYIQPFTRKRFDE